MPGVVGEGAGGELPEVGGGAAVRAALAGAAEEIADVYVACGEHDALDVEVVDGFQELVDLLRAVEAEGLPVDGGGGVGQHLGAAGHELHGGGAAAEALEEPGELRGAEDLALSDAVSAHVEEEDLDGADAAGEEEALCLREAAGGLGPHAAEGGEGGGFSGIRAVCVVGAVVVIVPDGQGGDAAEEGEEALVVPVGELTEHLRVLVLPVGLLVIGVVAEHEEEIGLVVGDGVEDGEGAVAEVEAGADGDPGGAGAFAQGAKLEGAGGAVGAGEGVFVGGAGGEAGEGEDGDEPVFQAGIGGALDGAAGALHAEGEGLRVAGLRPEEGGGAGRVADHGAGEEGT